MSELGQVIDHAAELQARIDRVELELQVLALSLLFLTVTVALLVWQAKDH